MDKKKSQTEKDDPFAIETTRIINSLKDSQPLWTEYMKAMQKYLAQMTAFMQAGAGVIETLARLGEHVGGDVGKGLVKLAEYHKSIEEHRSRLVKAWDETIISKLNERLANDKEDALRFEKHYKGLRANSLKNLKKAEANQAKYNKAKAKAKNPDKAEESDKALDQSSREHDKMLREQLRTVVRLERRRYCYFLQQYNFLMDMQINEAKEDAKTIRQCQIEMGNLPDTGDDISGKPAR